MTSWSLAARSLRFYFRSHLGAIIGAAIATSVLTGALLVGDSVRESLRQMALARLGKIDFAIASGDRLFRDGLAGEVQSSLTNARVVSVLQLPATASNPDGNSRANLVQVNGVSTNFWTLANQPPGSAAAALSDNTVWVNDRLASQLKVKPGDSLILRLPRISHLSRDAPLAPEEDATVAIRLKVGQVLSAGQFGAFGLQASQLPPFNAFVPLEFLQGKVNATNQANLLLAASGAPNADAIQAAFNAHFRPADAQLQWQLTPSSNFVELRTSRVFLEESVTKNLRVSNAVPIFTYFVNQFRSGTNTTPYSMVTASVPPYVPADLKDDEIVLNQWLAEDLNAKPGDTLALSYFVMGVMRDLVKKTNLFRVHSIVPMELPFTDPTLMPDFPGMTDAENCRDWNTGFPIDTGAIRDKDEAYWDKYRGAPKAFVTLATGQKLWSNRFGNLSAIRFPVGGNDPSAALDRWRSTTDYLDPHALGFVARPVRQEALASSAGAQDFGGLFIGFSFFLIASALILMSLLFRFALEQRGVEVGSLLALGFPAKKVRRLLLFEGLGLAAIGGIIGLLGGIAYAKGMLLGLSTVWSEAVAGSVLQYHGRPETLMTGFFSGVMVAVLTIWWSLRKEGKRPVRELLDGGLENEFSTSGAVRSKRNVAGSIIGIAALLAGIGIVVWGLAQGEQARADLFFSAGGLILIGGLVLCSAFIRRLEFSSIAGRLSLTGMGVRSITRRRKRSRAAICLLACGAFLIASIGAFRLDAAKDAVKRTSGTGGFALVGESSLPVVQNLNAEPGREFYGLTPRDLDGVSFVQFRVLPGDDASCLNLNRATRPRLLGVNPEALAQRNAFTFSKTFGAEKDSNPWLLLDRDFGPDVVPAIGDAASIQYAMGKSVGDELVYQDQNGREFKVKIVGAVANSILQGNLVISEKNFTRRFPGEAGYRMFLIDAPSNRAESVAAALSRAMQDSGMEITSARERLAAFNAVQNTYLGTFQMLGGLGLLLGTFGLGIILLRNVYERRGEFALLLAVGYRKSALRWLVLSEHGVLLLLGLFVGVVAAAIAVLPALLTPGKQLPVATLALTLGAVLLCGLLWTLAASSLALRAPLLKSLRNE